MFSKTKKSEKVYNRVPRERQECDIAGRLLMSIKSLYCQPEVCVRVNGKQSKLLHVSVGLRQECVLSPLFFIIYMNRMDKFSRIDDCVKIGRCKTFWLLFADDLVFLASSESGLQHALNGFAAACDIVGMTISTSKTEVLHLSRNLVHCKLAEYH